MTNVTISARNVGEEFALYLKNKFKIELQGTVMSQPEAELRYYQIFLEQLIEYVPGVEEYVKRRMEVAPNDNQS